MGRSSHRISEEHKEPEHPLGFQTCMNAQLISKHVRNVSSAGTKRRSRNVIRTKRLASRKRFAGLNEPVTPPDPHFHPARSLMICLGWLQLFRTIVSGSRPFS